MIASKNIRLVSHKLLSLLFTVTLFGQTMAQEEVLLPLQFNVDLYHQTKEYQSNTKILFNYRNFIITSDTLNIPFVDDFSRNTLKPFQLEPTNIIDTIKFATGPCIENGEFDIRLQGFLFDSSYTYTYDISTNTLDSTANSPVLLVNYSEEECFPTSTSFTQFWLPYYRFTADDFDPITGDKLDSVLVEADTLISVGSVIFAQLDPAAKWVDNYAFWNTTFPILPPTIGVATLDGLNEFGLPYNNSIVNAFGDADLLTSKPIDLSGLNNDSAVYLSFFYQMEGLGDFPNINDSLIVEFRNEFDGSWVNVWSISSEDVPSNDFIQAYINVRDTNLIAGPKYFYPSFQFRFRNKASISGNNDHWHIDYVRLDKNRSTEELDAIIRDVAFINDFPNYLENYSQLPWKQFQAGADQFTANITIPIRDNGQEAGIQAGAFPLNVYIDNTENSDTIFKEEGANFNPTEIIKGQTFFPSADFTFPLFEAENVCLRNLMYIAPTDRNTLLLNDTLFNEICFGNVMAYDDGSAERAYGVQGGNPNDVKKFAYEFNVSTPDTLAAIQIHFSNIDQDVSNLIFSLFVWDSLELNAILPFENVIGTIENKRPIYIDERNGFATFVFDTAITVSGKFYVGWAQLDNRNLQIGYDLNSIKGRDHMYLFLNNQWRPSTINTPGSPMMRVILDGSFPLDTPNVTSISSLTSKDFNLRVYPNPTNSELNIVVPESIRDYEIKMYDFAGKQVLTESNLSTVNVNRLVQGMYFIQLTDMITGAHYFSMFIKTNQ